MAGAALVVWVERGGKGVEVGCNGSLVGRNGWGWDRATGDGINGMEGEGRGGMAGVETGLLWMG